MKIKNCGIILAVAIFAGGYIALISWWIFAQWNECRDLGLSVFYCIKHIL